MPQFLEKILRQAAAKKGKKGRAADRYVYGAMNNMGAMRGNRETAAGAAMERKHERKLVTESHAYNWRQHRGGRKPKKKS